MKMTFQNSKFLSNRMYRFTRCLAHSRILDRMQSFRSFATITSLVNPHSELYFRRKSFFIE